MGILQPILDAEARRGNRAKVSTSPRALHGEPPSARLNRPLDRSVIEAEFELGPLVEWWKPDRSTWNVCDTLTRTWIAGGVWNPWGAFRNRRAQASDRRLRLGWVSDDPRLVGSADEPLARTIETATCREAPDVATRIETVLSAEFDELPTWFVERCRSEGSRWDLERWRRSMLAGEQTWRLDGIEVQGSHQLVVSFTMPVGLAPIGSLDFLIAAADDIA